MRSVRVLALAVIAPLLIAVATPALADKDEGKKIKLTGLVVSVDPGNTSFVIREFREEEHRWVVILHREAKVEAGSDERSRRQLTSGDIVEIEGQVLNGRTILAKKIKVLAFGSGQLPPGPAQPSPSQQPPGSNPVASVIKTLGVGVAVSMFSPMLNTFINNLLQARDAETAQTTKVVPILSISIGIKTPGQASIGAAQVAGTSAQLQKVKAVAAVDANFQETWRIRALVPVDSLEPWKQLRRVPGVGVSAIIDLRI